MLTPILSILAELVSPKERKAHPHKKAARKKSVLIFFQVTGLLLPGSHRPTRSDLFQRGATTGDSFGIIGPLKSNCDNIKVLLSLPG